MREVASTPLHAGRTSGYSSTMQARRWMVAFSVGAALACRPTAAVIPVGDGVMLSMDERVYTEPGLLPSELAALQRANETALQNLVRAFDLPLRSSPWVLFCHTASCKVVFGAAPESASAADLGFARDGLQLRDGWKEQSIVVVTGPVEGSARILTHERVHAEMKAWVPYDALPTWFNEGMATLVAGEPRCEGVALLSSFDVTQLNTKQAWQEHLRTHAARETYCQSRQAVAAWTARFPDGKQTAAALRALMADVAAGSSFERAFAK